MPTDQMLQDDHSQPREKSHRLRMLVIVTARELTLKLISSAHYQC